MSVGLKRMRKTLSILLLFFVASGVLAVEVDPFKGPKPVAVLIQTDPWLMVIGSDTPMIAIYEDGQVIYLKREKEKEPSYVHKQLTKQGLEAVKQKIASFGDYSMTKRYYDLAPNVTDQPKTMIYLNVDGKKLVTIVYGLRVSQTKLPAYTVSPGRERPDQLPRSLQYLHDYLTNLSFDDSRQWTPKYIEVIIWPYEYAPDKSIYWPKDWPGLDSPNTTRRGDSYSIFLPGSELAKLRDFLKTQKERGAVQIDGKKWAVSYRFTFPSEPVWFQAFR